MKVIFESIANEFDGDQRTRTVNSSEPESHLNELIETVRDRFDVTAGSYPGDGRKRITLQR